MKYVPLGIVFKLLYFYNEKLPCIIRAQLKMDECILSAEKKIHPAFPKTFHSY